MALYYFDPNTQTWGALADIVAIEVPDEVAASGNVEDIEEFLDIEYQNDKERPVMVNPGYETSAGYEDGKVVWTIVQPGGGDMVADFPDYMPSGEQERHAKAICGEI